MSRAMGTFRAFCVKAVLAGAGLTQLVAGPLCAQSSLPAPGGAPVSATSGGQQKPTASNTSGDPRTAARNNLLLARSQLAQGNLDIAESLAKEVAATGLTYAPREDSPAKVLQDVKAARTDPKMLLKAARASLSRKELDDAERYARLADKHGSMLSFWSDSPSKVLKEVAAARKAGGTATAKASGNASAQGKFGRPGTSSSSSSPRKGGTDTAKVMPGEKKPAETIVQTSATTPATAAGASGSAASETAATPLPRNKEQAKSQLAQARQMLAAGKLDEATKVAQRIKTQSHISWGLFEDTPDRLVVDVQKARVKRDQAESVKVLAQARQLYAKGDYDTATKLAHRAQSLHGEYSFWDLGDRPSRLLSDIQTAQARARKTKLPPVKGAKNDVQMASKTGGKDGVGIQQVGGTSAAPVVTQSPAGGAVPNTGPSPTSSPNKLRAQQLVAEAKRLLEESKGSKAPEEKLILARQKSVEAQRLGASFGPDEVSPEYVYQHVTLAVKARIDQRTRWSDDALAQGNRPSAQKHLSEARTLAADFGMDVRPIETRLASLTAPSPVDAGSGQPLPPLPGVDSSLPLPPPTAMTTTTTTTTTVVKGPSSVVPDDGLPGKVAPPPPSVTPPAPAPAPVAANQGPMLLEKARLELQKGETSTARRLAEEALRGNHGVNEEAMAVLRTIDTEEANQKKLAANRAFDAAMSAYRRRDFPQASAMIAAIDTHLLDGDRMARLREINLTPEMSPTRTRGPVTPGGAAGGTGLMRTGGTAPAGVGVGQALPGIGSGNNTTAVGKAGSTGRATATDLVPPAVVNNGSGNGTGEDGALDDYRQRQKVMVELYRQKGLDAQRDASEKFRAGQYQAALEMLQDYLNELTELQVSPTDAGRLRRPVETRLSHYRLLAAQKELASGAIAARNASADRVAMSMKAEEMKRKNVEKLMKEFTSAYKEGKYTEAEALAMRARDLDPDNAIVSASIELARRHRAVNDYKDIKKKREDMVLTGLNDAENEGPSSVIHQGVTYDKDRWDRVKGRKPLTPIELGRPSEKEKAIERRLSTPVNLTFEETPLSRVIDELRAINNINIDVDTPALQEQGISLDSKISIKLDQVSLKSALNLILHKVRLTHVIKDEVLLITTEENARGKQRTVTYQVADLVIPVTDFGDVRNAGYTAMPGQTSSGPNALVNGQPTPVTGPNTLVGGTAVGSPTGASMLNGAVPPGGGATSSSGMTTSVSKGRAATTEAELIKLITSTIQPRTWAEMGGPGTIEYFPLTMSLVINQAADIQEQIQDLLAALRRLQDQQVAVEVRFISLSEDFFERVGVNFNVNIRNNDSTRFQPSLLQNSFVTDPTRFINAFNPGRFIAGATPAGTLTPSLDIPINNQTFFQTVPAFGGYTAGGLSMGLAFLSDIQVFLFLEAVQGDRRSNVMQAPKLTLFNGQTSTLNVFDSQTFVSGVQVAALPGGQFAFVPQIQSIPGGGGGGTTVTIQAVISADRRFARLSLTPTLTNLAPSPVAVFPVVVPIFTSFDGNSSGQPIVFTQFIQQPIFQNVSIQTTVAVPDGGTVLMGGLKRLSESRSEYGAPVLSKVPYLNRLFKNVGYGRETASLLIMVTVRIIIQEEEEELQTGFSRPTVERP